MKKNNHRGGSGYTKQFKLPLAQSGGSSIPTCTNSTTSAHNPGQQPGLVIDVSNPLLNYQMSTPFDGNKFGSALDTVQNPTTCKYAGPGALEQVAIGGKKKTVKKRTPKKKTAKKTVKKSTPKKKTVKRVVKKTVKKSTPKKKTVKRAVKKTTPKKKTVKRTVKKSTPKKKTTKRKMKK